MREREMKDIDFMSSPRIDHKREIKWFIHNEALWNSMSSLKNSCHGAFIQLQLKTEASFFPDRVSKKYSEIANALFSTCYSASVIPPENK
jgi:hypothetical protein